MPGNPERTGRIVHHDVLQKDLKPFWAIPDFCQALQKRGVPRALVTDNGSAMTADEFRSGLHTLGIVHETTLPYSPYHYVAEIDMSR